MAMLAIGLVAMIVIAVAAFAYIYFSNGTLEIVATDPPPDWGLATQVYLNYSAIEVHRMDADNSSGWFTVADGGMINLTRIIDVNKTIGSTNIQSGTYNLIRFNIKEAIVTVNGVNYSATVPSTQLQIAITKGGVAGIAVNGGQTAKLLIELNIKVEGTVDSLRIVPDIRAEPI